jgi:hypothetical protein
VLTTAGRNVAIETGTPRVHLPIKQAAAVLTGRYLHERPADSSSRYLTV